jgi:hypothetical protein
MFVLRYISMLDLDFAAPSEAGACKVWRTLERRNTMACMTKCCGKKKTSKKAPAKKAKKK